MCNRALWNDEKQGNYLIDLNRKNSIIKTMKTIDVTPTWAGLMPAMIQVLRNPNANKESVQGITEELIRLAKIADSKKS